jgi:hypothetical protein
VEDVMDARTLKALKGSIQDANMTDNIRDALRSGNADVFNDLKPALIDHLMEIVMAYERRGNQGLVDEFAAVYDAAIEALAADYEPDDPDETEVNRWLDNRKRMRDMNKELS